jgi:hypothetical protein
MPDRCEQGCRREQSRQCEPGRRHRCERGVGNGSLAVRIELSTVQEVDEEALGWLSLAYAQNTASAGARPTACG